MDPTKLIKPVNKTASLVTNQSACFDEILISYSHVEQYKAEARALSEALEYCDDPDVTRKIKARIGQIGNLIHEQRKKHKHEPVSLFRCFVHICSKQMSDEDFSNIMKQAKNMADKINMK